MPGLPGISLLVLQVAEVDHGFRRCVGVAGADRLLVPVPGLPGIPLLLLQEAEADHGCRGVVGVAGADGLLVPVAAALRVVCLVVVAGEVVEGGGVDGGAVVVEEAACGGPGVAGEGSVADVAALVAVEVAVGVVPEGVGDGPGDIFGGVVGQDGEQGVRGVAVTAGDGLQVDEPGTADGGGGGGPAQRVGVSGGRHRIAGGGLGQVVAAGAVEVAEHVVAQEAGQVGAVPVGDGAQQRDPVGALFAAAEGEGLAQRFPGDHEPAEEQVVGVVDDRPQGGVGVMAAQGVAFLAGDRGQGDAGGVLVQERDGLLGDAGSVEFGGIEGGQDPQPVGQLAGQGAGQAGEPGRGDRVQPQYRPRAVAGGGPPPGLGDHVGERDLRVVGEGGCPVAGEVEPGSAGQGPGGPGQPGSLHDDRPLVRIGECLAE